MFSCRFIVDGQPTMADIITQRRTSLAQYDHDPNMNRSNEWACIMEGRLTHSLPYRHSSYFERRLLPVSVLLFIFFHIIHALILINPHFNSSSSLKMVPSQPPVYTQPPVCLPPVLPVVAGNASPR